MREPSNKFVQETKNFWQPYYGEKLLTDEDAREIYKNITGLFSILVKLEVRRMREQEELEKLKVKTKEDSTKQAEVEPKERLIPASSVQFFARKYLKKMQKNNCGRIALPKFKNKHKKMRLARFQLRCRRRQDV